MFVCSITILNVVAEEYEECDLTIENYVVNGKYFTKISFIFNVDGPCCNYECYDQPGYATCLKKRQFKSMESLNLPKGHVYYQPRLMSLLFILDMIKTMKP